MRTGNGSHVSMARTDKCKKQATSEEEEASMRRGQEFGYLYSLCLDPENVRMHRSSAMWTALPSNGLHITAITHFCRDFHSDQATFVVFERRICRVCDGDRRLEAVRSNNRHAFLPISCLCL